MFPSSRRATAFGIANEQRNPGALRASGVAAQSFRAFEALFQLPVDDTNAQTPCVVIHRNQVRRVISREACNIQTVRQERVPLSMFFWI